MSDGYPVGPLSDDERRELRRRLDEATAILDFAGWGPIGRCCRCGSKDDVVFVETPRQSLPKCAECRK